MEDIDWDNMFEPKPPVDNSVNLNLIDLDFLANIGGDSPPKKAEVKQAGTKQAAKPIQSKVDTNSDPAAILSKLNSN